MNCASFERRLGCGGGEDGTLKYPRSNLAAERGVSLFGLNPARGRGFGYNTAVQLGSGVLVTLGTEGDGLVVAQLPELAEALRGAGAKMLVVADAPPGERGAEPISALGAIARSSGLHLGAVCSLAKGRRPQILARHASALALLHRGPTLLVLEDAPGDPEARALIEALEIAALLRGPGPHDYAGTHFRLAGAHNEPRSKELLVGAVLPAERPIEITHQLAARSEVLFVEGSVPELSPALDVEVVEIVDPGVESKQRSFVVRTGGSVKAVLRDYRGTLRAAS